MKASYKNTFMRITLFIIFIIFFPIIAIMVWYFMEDDKDCADYDERGFWKTIFDGYWYLLTGNDLTEE